MPRMREKDQSRVGRLGAARKGAGAATDPGLSTPFVCCAKLVIAAQTAKHTNTPRAGRRAISSFLTQLALDAGGWAEVCAGAGVETGA